MFGWLEDIWHAILDLPYVLVGLVVESINGWILILAGLLSLLLSVLPGFPSLPEIAELPGIELLAYWMPIKEMLGVFSAFVVAWVIWMAYSLIAKRVGVV